MAKRTVLVVSEFPYYRKLLTMLLVALNYEVLLTSEVAAAVESTDEKRSHVALVDLSRKPRVRGSDAPTSREIAAQVRAHLAEPSLVVAVYWDAANLEGFDAGIEKTETLLDVEATVEAWFRKVDESS